LEDSVTAKGRLLWVVLALTLALAAGSPPCLAETASTANPAPPHGRPAKQPAFCFQGAAPDRQEASRYAERAQRDASRTSHIRAGVDRDDAAFVAALALIGAALIVGGIYVASLGI